MSDKLNVKIALGLLASAGIAFGIYYYQKKVLNKESN